MKNKFKNRQYENKMGVGRECKEARTCLVPCPKSSDIANPFSSVLGCVNDKKLEEFCPKIPISMKKINKKWIVNKSPELLQLLSKTLLNQKTKKGTELANTVTQTSMHSQKIIESLPLKNSYIALLIFIHQNMMEREEIEDEENKSPKDLPEEYSNLNGTLQRTHKNGFLVFGSRLHSRPIINNSCKDPVKSGHRTNLSLNQTQIRYLQETPKTAQTNISSRNGRYFTHTSGKVEISRQSPLSIARNKNADYRTRTMMRKRMLAINRGIIQDLEIKIEVLQKKNQEQQNEIMELRATNESIVAENERLRKLTKEIMLDQHNQREMASTVHSFYHNVYLTETEVGMSQLRANIAELKKKMTDLQGENRKIVESNTSLKSTLTLYRNIARESQQRKDYSPSNRETEDKPKAYPVTKMNSPLKFSLDSTEIFDKHKAARTEAMKENVHLGMIASSLKKISKSQNLRSLVECLYRELATLLRVHKIGIFILEAQLKKIYQSEKGRVQTVNTGKEYIDLVINEATFATYNLKPAFRNSSYIKGGIRIPGMIVLSVGGAYSKHEKELYLAIQLESEEADEKSVKGSWIRNEMVLSIFCAQSGVLIDKFLHKFMIQERAEFHTDLLRFSSRICGERNHQCIAEAIEEDLASCFGFEKACLLFVEGKKLPNVYEFFSVWITYYKLLSHNHLQKERYNFAQRGEL